MACDDMTLMEEYICCYIVQADIQIYLEAEIKKFESNTFIVYVKEIRQIDGPFFSVEVLSDNLSLGEPVCFINCGCCYYSVDKE